MFKIRTFLNANFTNFDRFERELLPFWTRTLRSKFVTFDVRILANANVSKTNVMNVVRERAQPCLLVDSVVQSRGRGERSGYSRLQALRVKYRNLIGSVLDLPTKWAELTN